MLNTKTRSTADVEPVLGWGGHHAISLGQKKTHVVSYKSVLDLWHFPHSGIKSNNKHSTFPGCCGSGHSERLQELRNIWVNVKLCLRPFAGQGKPVVVQAPLLHKWTAWVWRLSVSVCKQLPAFGISLTISTICHSKHKADQCICKLFFNLGPCLVGSIDRW